MNETRPDPGVIHLSIRSELPRPEAFDMLIDELRRELGRRGAGVTLDSETSPADTQGAIARVAAWDPPRRLTLELSRAEWQPAVALRMEVSVDDANEGSSVSIIVQHLAAHTGPGDAVAWFVDVVAAPLIAAAAPDALGDWLTDRRARRPAGAAARATYSDPTFHYPNFGPLLEELALTADDLLLEVGCGGGALLREALRSGCRAAAVDHSADMVATARRTNAEAVAAGRLEVLEASADRLPFGDATFSCAAMTGVLGFLDDPVQALREIRRVLKPAARFVAFGSDPAWRGTPAAPEPYASRLSFFTDVELETIALDAGFTRVRVVRRDLEPYARDRVPAEAIPLFQGTAPYLVAYQ